jgi:ASC-1-like (ASCH) protein
MVEKEVFEWIRTGQKTIEVINGKQNKVMMKQLRWIEFIDIHL